jgi:hypothetical protein
MTGLPRIDPTEPDERAADTDAKRVLFQEAQELLNEKGVFLLAIRALRIRWYGEWLDCSDRDKERDYKARLKIIDAVPAEIQRFVNDYKMTMDRQRKHAGRP